MTGKHIRESLKKLVEHLPLCDDHDHRRVISALWFFLLLLPIHQLITRKLEFTEWDLLLFTGLATFIYLLNAARRIPSQFEAMLKRLIARDIITLDQNETTEDLLKRLEAEADWFSRCFGLVFGLAFLIALLYVQLHDYKIERTLLVIVDTICGYVAGIYAGRMISYGRLGWRLERNRISIQANPAHVDGVAGLKPAGDFYFSQAMLVALPAIYVAVWWFLFPIWPLKYDASWQDAYFGLLGLAILAEILAFIVPLWFFHAIMSRQKQKWLVKADELSLAINELQAQDSSQSAEGSEIRTERLEQMKKQFWDIENMSTWPVDLPTRRRFKLNNLLLFVPLIGDLVKRTPEWKHIESVLKNLGGP